MYYRRIIQQKKREGHVWGQMDGFLLANGPLRLWLTRGTLQLSKRLSQSTPGNVSHPPVLLAMEGHYDVTGTDNNILCNIMGAVYTFKRKSKQISMGTNNGDTNRVLCQVQDRTKSIHLHHHVRAHQDYHTACANLPLEAQLNYHCHDLAKESIVEGIINGVKTRQKSQ